jgi:hypothetical protein
MWERTSRCGEKRVNNIIIIYNTFSKITAEDACLHTFTIDVIIMVEKKQLQLRRRNGTLSF